VTEPKEMPADSAEVDDIIFAVTGLRASDWVAEDQKDAKQYQLDHPRVTVTMSASTRPVGVGAATQTATNPASQPAVATLKIGRYDDVLRKNVMVASSDNPAIAKAPANIIETLNKKPIEFRDKKAVQIIPDHVAKIEILSDVPATTRPTSKPAVKKEVIIKRHVPTLPMGIAAPTSQMAAATSKPAAAATQASSQPAPATKPTFAATEPAGKWELLGEKTEPAADAKVDDLLLAINPLRAEKYLDAKPATSQPAPTYTLKITTQAPGGAAPEQHVLTVVDVDETKPPVATYEDLSFEVSRAVVDKLKQDFSKSAAPAGNIANTPTPGFPEAVP
jgi:hypothetical protein